ncbi:SED5-binding protein 3 [Trichomonascus vanleenenianus]|uniref:Sfb3p n=1 Tax=Trichomonascus vanleenenianus TaxID=2268995 RepID=UPI003ECA6F6F
MTPASYEQQQQRKYRRKHAHAYYDFSHGTQQETLQKPQQGDTFVPRGPSPGFPTPIGTPMASRTPEPSFQPSMGQRPLTGPEDPHQQYTNSPPADALPNLPASRDFFAEKVAAQPFVFKTFENACPPPALSEYGVEDQGIAGPNFARMTMYNVPISEQLRKETELPLGIIVQPFAPTDDPVPIVDFSETEPPRCRRCRAYMNPSMLFIQGGTKFVCNMCQHTNAVSSDYFQPTDQTNRRIDWQTRPELAYGTYDIIVPKEFWKDGKEPVPLHELFLIDVSTEAVKKEIPKLAVEAIRALLYSENSRFPKGGRIGIMTFDKNLHFYNLHPNLTQAQMVVMSDIDDTFIPLEEGLFVDPEESRLVIEDLLNRLDILFENNMYSEPAYGAALDAAQKALEETGGKVSVMLSVLPTWGPGHLFVRDESQYKSEAQYDLLRASNQFYLDMARRYAVNGIGLDTYFFPSSYIDVTNSGHVGRFSGGREHYYPRFVPERDGQKFIAEFVRANSGETATQGILKIRCSNGMQVHKYVGNIFQERNETTADPYLGVTGEHTALGALFTYDGKLDTKLDAHFQAALLYTSATGQRRVRVINILASVTEQYRNVMKFVDVEACMAICTRDALDKLGFVPIKEIKAGLIDKTVDIFAAYRKHNGVGMPPTQLLMPVSLHFWCIYILAFIKSRPLRATKVVSDARRHASRVVNCMDIDLHQVYLYPRIIGIHNLREADCTYTEAGQFNMPVNVTATMSSIDVGGTYIIYNGQRLLLYIHRQVNPQLIKDLFGESFGSVAELDPYLNSIPELDTDINIKTRALVDYFARKTHLTKMTIQLARQGIDGAEYDVNSMLIEDRNMESYGYRDFVAHVHRGVQVALENKSSKAATHLLNETINLTHGGI